MTQEDNNNEEKKSLLSDIIQTSKEEQVTATEITIPSTTIEAQEVVKKPKEPIPPATIIKAVLSLFFTSVVFLAF